MELLVIRSAYNNLITEDIIKQYKNKILFSYIDYENMQYFIYKYKIEKYYSFMEVLPSIQQLKFIDYYQDSRVIANDIMYIAKRGQKILHIRKLFPMTWLDFINYDNFVITKDVSIYNIPFKILNEKKKDIVIFKKIII